MSNMDDTLEAWAKQCSERLNRRKGAKCRFRGKTGEGIMLVMKINREEN